MAAVAAIAAQTERSYQKQQFDRDGKIPKLDSALQVRDLLAQTGGTADFTDSWVYESAADTYALDPEMVQKLRDANPEAFRNIVGRMLEAHGRGFWQPDAQKLEKLRALYERSVTEIEGVTVE